ARKPRENLTAAAELLRDLLRDRPAHPAVKAFVCGALSGTCSTLLFQPLDLIKTRLQTLRRDVRRGSPRIGMVAVVVSVQHFFLERSPGPGEAVLLGAAARAVAGVFMLPVTVVKARYESGMYSYGSVFGALSSMCRTEGPQALYSGLTATLLRDVPFSGMYVMFYTQVKATLPQAVGLSPCAPLANFGCGVLAGAMASLVTQPADVIKTHVQVSPQLFRRHMDVVWYVYKVQGLTGFFRGVVPRSLRRTMMAAMAWTVYEQLMAQVGLKS
ncbi:hypothetical protein Z043_105475, partial [Scleropages formosus]